MAATGGHGGVLVSLGGDIAVAGTPPRHGWPVTVARNPDPGGVPRGQLVRLAAGAVATSSVTVRRWHRGGIVLHHIVDPRTGRPADGPWRTATVAAVTCADANAASTAAIVAGPAAEDWLAEAGLPGPADRARRSAAGPERLAGHGRGAGAGAGRQLCIRRGAAMSAVLGGSQALWFVSRASGLAMLAGFSAAVVAGVGARLGPGPAPARGRRAAPDAGAVLRRFPRAARGHGDPRPVRQNRLGIDGIAARVPYRTLAIGLGALAVDLGGAVLVTSLIRQRAGLPGLRAVHRLAYLAWPTAFWHAVTAGNDLRIWWVALVLWGCTRRSAQP